MATTISAVQTKVNNRLQDSSTNIWSASQRLSAISIATQEIMTELGLGEQVRQATLNYLDGIHYYNITSDIADNLDSVDLQRKEGLNYVPFVRKDPRSLAVDIDIGSTEEAFAIDKRDGNTYLLINHSSSYSAKLLESCDSLTSNGTWEVDSTNSDATNLTLDTVEYNQGSGSFNFDIDVSQSGNNKATLKITDFTSTDLSDDEDISSLVFDIYIPDVTYFSSVTAYLGSSTSAYWSGTATTDYSGASFTTGEWNTVSIAWSDMTPVGSGDSSAIDYLQFDFNYSASQGDDTDFRLDNIRMIRPESLIYKYQSSRVGVDNSGTDIYAFTATTDIPFYSGQYDYLDNTISFRAAAILFEDAGALGDADRMNGYYANSLSKIKKKFPNFLLKETKSFRVKGLNFNK